VSIEDAVRDEEGNLTSLNGWNNYTIAVSENEVVLFLN
jgi:hypothetical protein